MPMTIEQRRKWREQRQRERQQEEEIEAAKAATGAVEVWLHHTPVWLAKRCRVLLRERGRLPKGWYNFAIVNECAREIDWCLDHHGTSDRGPSPI